MSSSLILTEFLAVGLMASVALTPALWRYLQQRGR